MFPRSEIAYSKLRLTAYGYVLVNISTGQLATAFAVFSETLPSFRTNRRRSTARSWSRAACSPPPLLGVKLIRRRAKQKFIVDRAPGCAEGVFPTLPRRPAPMEVAFEHGESSSEVVPVSFETLVTETGMLQLWCVACDGRRWKLEFNVRERVEV